MAEEVTATQAQRLAPLFSERKKGERRRCLIDNCSFSFADGTGDGSLVYHVLKLHNAVGTRCNFSHPRFTAKRRREESSADSASVSSSGSSQRQRVMMAEVVVETPPPLTGYPSLSLSQSSSTTALLDDDTPSIFHSGSNTTPRSSFSSPPFYTQQPRYRQPSITTHLTPIIQESTVYCLAECFAVNSIPFSLASSPLFHKALNSYRQGTGPPPERRELATQVFDNVRSMRPVVLGRLRASPGVTIGMDGWTNVRHEKVINLVPVANGVAYYWDSVILKKRSTAQAQLPLISEGISSIMKNGVIVAGISSDNEMVNYTLFELLSVPFPFLVHVPCAAHTIQLLVKSALSLPAITTSLDTMDALLHALEGSKQLRNTLEQLQATLRPNRIALKHQLFNSTRWSSRLRSIQRLLELKTCLCAMTDKIVEHLSKSKKVAWQQFRFEESWWQTLIGLKDFLTPYQIATDVVQSDGSCLMDIYYQFVSLAHEAAKLSPPHPLATIKDSIDDMIRVQWLGDGRARKSHVNISAVIMCAVFSFDDEYKQEFDKDHITAANIWFLRWATDFII